MKSVDFIHFFRIVLILSWMVSYLLAHHYLWYLWLKTRDKSDNWPWHFSFLWAFDKINLLSNMKCRKSIFIFQPAESILLYVTLQKFEVYAWWYATVEYLLSVVAFWFFISWYIIFCLIIILNALVMVWSMSTKICEIFEAFCWNFFSSINLLLFL